MKLSFLVYLCAALLSFNAFAEIERGMAEQVLKNPGVSATFIFSNDAIGGNCRIPDVSDVQIGCTGALPSVTKPTMLEESCFFKVVMPCPVSGPRWVVGVLIAGRILSYTLALPGGNIGGDTSREIVIDHVASLAP